MTCNPILVVSKLVMVATLNPGPSAFNFVMEILCLSDTALQSDLVIRTQNNPDCMVVIGIPGCWFDFGVYLTPFQHRLQFMYFCLNRWFFIMFWLWGLFLFTLDIVKKWSLLNSSIKILTAIATRCPLSSLYAMHFL